jgi:hypothetical protein
MIFIDVIKANIEIGKLNKSLQDMTTDRDAQITKLQEFEAKNKDYIESAQTAEQMKSTHAKELETMKAEYEQKLADKDKELAQVKEQSVKEVTEVKESVAAETIALVASQGTTVVVDSAVPMTIKDALAKLKSLKGQAAQNFYTENKQLFEGYIKNPTV